MLPSSLSAGLLLSAAAALVAPGDAATGSIADIEHIVVFMQVGPPPPPGQGSGTLANQRCGYL